MIDMIIKKTNIAAVFVLIFVTIAVYIPAFRGGYIFDDRVLIKNNPSIRSVANIPLFFVSKDARVPKEFSGLQDDIYRPFQTISYTISYFLWGNNPSYFHAENIFIHILNGILLYYLLILIFRKRFLSFLASLLFLIHPVNVEAVTYLAGRSDVLALFFFLLSLITFLKSRQNKKKGNFFFILISLLFFAASLFSKETAVVLPFVIILYLFLCESNSEKWTINKLAMSSWYYFLILAVFLLLRTYNLGKIAQLASRNAGLVFLTMMKVFSEYLRLIFFPLSLTFFPQIESSSARLDAVYLFYIIVAGLFLYICIRSVKKDKMVAFLLLSYLVALLPVSNIIPIKSYMQERFLYIPCIFVLGCVSYLIIKIWEKIIVSKGFMFKTVSCLILVLYAGALGVRTFARNIDWVDQETLVKKEIAMHPDSGQLCFDMGISYFRRKDYNKSEKYLKKALEKKLSDLHRTMVYDSLGNIYNIRSDQEHAIEFYRKAIQISPTYFNSLNSLGDLYFKQLDFKNAKYYFEKAVNVWPDSPMFNKNLGSAYIMLGDKENALKYWKKSLRLDPHQPDVKEFISRNE